MIENDDNMRKYMFSSLFFTIFDTKASITDTNFKDVVVRVNDDFLRGKFKGWVEHGCYEI